MQATTTAHHRLTLRNGLYRNGKQIAMDTKSQLAVGLLSTLLLNLALFLTGITGTATCTISNGVASAYAAVTGERE